MIKKDNEAYLKSGARPGVRHSDKVLDIFERSKEVLGMLWAAHGVHKKRYEVFSVKDSHARFPQPARRTMETQRQGLGRVRRCPWHAPVSCRGNHIEAFVREERLHQQRATPPLLGQLAEEKKCFSCKQCRPHEEKEKMYDTLAAKW